MIAFGAVAFFVWWSTWWVDGHSWNPLTRRSTGDRFRPALASELRRPCAHRRSPEQHDADDEDPERKQQERDEPRWPREGKQSEHQ